MRKGASAQGGSQYRCDTVQGFIESRYVTRREADERGGGGRSLTSTQAVHWIVHGLGGGGGRGS